MVMSWVTVVIVFLAIAIYLGWLVSLPLTYWYKRRTVKLKKNNDNKKE